MFTAATHGPTEACALSIPLSPVSTPAARRLMWPLAPQHRPAPRGNEVEKREGLGHSIAGPRYTGTTATSLETTGTKMPLPPVPRSRANVGPRGRKRGQHLPDRGWTHTCPSRDAGASPATQPILPPVNATRANGGTRGGNVGPAPAGLRPGEGQARLIQTWGQATRQALIVAH